MGNICGKQKETDSDGPVTDYPYEPSSSIRSYQYEDTDRLISAAPRNRTSVTNYRSTEYLGRPSTRQGIFPVAEHTSIQRNNYEEVQRIFAHSRRTSQNISDVAANSAKIQRNVETKRPTKSISSVWKPTATSSNRANVEISQKRTTIPNSGTVHKHIVTVDVPNVTIKSQNPTVNSQPTHSKTTANHLNIEFDSLLTKHGDGSHTFTNLYTASQQKQEQKIPFKSYMPCYETRNFYNNDFKKFPAYNSRAVRLFQLIAELKLSSNPLTEQNYLDALVLFADIEDLYCEVAIREYNRKSEKIKNSDKTKYYIMHIPNLSDSRPSISENGRLTIDSSQLEKPKIYGTISNIEQDHILVEFKEEIDTSILYDVDFLSNRTTFRLEKLAADLMKQKKLVSFMFPNQIKAQNSIHIVDQQFTWFNKSIAENSEQQTAITNIYHGTSHPHPYILFGPPGTGKTTTLVESVLQLWKNKSETRILIVATSNFACNVISKRLLGFLPKTEMFRLFSKSQEMVINKIDDVILDASNLKSKNHYNPRPAELYPYRLIIATPTAIGRLISQGFACDHFTHLFVDECGSSTEGSTLIPIAGLISSSKTINANIVLAGDPLQLRPVILSKYAKDLGYSISMMERLMKLPLYQKDGRTGDYNNKFITKLLLNYRSHKDILHTSNQLFYKNELKALGSKRITDRLIDWRYLPNPKFPVMFEAVFGESLSENDSPSLYNQHEINAVMLYLQQLVNTNINGKVVRQSDIGVITPYRKQNQKIRNQLGGKWNKVEVATVEAFQGNEKSVIILSTVRSNVETMGFLSNERRLNVALTRAQSLMIIIGDPTVLMMDKCWYQLLKFCYDNNAICGKPFDFYK